MFTARDTIVRTIIHHDTGRVEVLVQREFVDANGVAAGPPVLLDGATGASPILDDVETAAAAQDFSTRSLVAKMKERHGVSTLAVADGVKAATDRKVARERDEQMRLDEIAERERINAEVEKEKQ